MNEVTSRTQDVLDILARMARGERELEIPISPERDLLDAFGFGINMLAAELRYTTLSRDELKKLFDAVLDMVVIVDSQGTIVQVNQAVLDRAGMCIEHWVGRPWTSLFDCGPCDFKDLTQRLARGEKLVDLEWTSLDSSGKTIPLMVSATPLAAPEGQSHIVLVAKDMRAAIELLQQKAQVEAERKRAAQLQQARDLAEEAARAKSTFLANVSHELRTPLTVVLSGIELLGRRDLQPGSRDKCLRQIESSARKLRLLVNDLLDSARVESGSLPIHPKPMALAPVLQELFEMHEPVARGKGLALQVVVEDSVPDQFETDPLRFQQILDNLLGNSVKFTRTGEVLLKIIREAGGEEKGELRLEVSDSGIGIPQDRQDRLFQPFTQADDSVSSLRRHRPRPRPFPNLARRLGGELSLAWSEEGRGSCFRLSLPIQSA